MKLVHASDIHFGAEDRAALAALDRRLAQERPDLIVVTGDLTQAGRRREFLLAADWLARLPAPVLTTPGNHDIPVWNVWQRFTAPFQRYAQATLGARPCIAAGGAVVAALRTSVPWQPRLDWSLGHVRRGALNDTLNCLAGHAGCRWKIVACHHPLADAAMTGQGQVQGRTRRGAAALERLAEAGAQIVLCGHVHTPFRREQRTVWGSLSQIAAGTLSTRLRGPAASVNVLTFTDEDWDLRVVPLA